MELKSFKINKLHDSLNFELKFENNTLILLGENGSCKTTIIKMLYYTLSLQWGKLGQYNFESIEIYIDNDYFKINKNDIIVSAGLINSKVLRKLPHSIRNIVISMIQKDNHIDCRELENICQQYNFPIELILQEIDIDEDIALFSDVNAEKKQRRLLIETMQHLRNKMCNLHILYLPTYRRIEQELKVVLDGKIDNEDFINRRIPSLRYSNSNNNNNYTELIEFGMCDVESAITDTLTFLKDSFRSNLNELTLSYLGDIVDKKYNTTSFEKLDFIDDSTIHQIMNRVDETILSKNRKDKLFETIRGIKERGVKYEHDKVVCHYFLKLYDSHKELCLNEATMRDFVNVCNTYLENKSIFYDSQSFNYVIKSKYNGDDIKLFQLSSGEKQIVSLFSHLYLSGKRNYLVLIDEPELSLSVKWQKMFLEDVKNGQFCKGLVAVTHSPFIFDNSLDDYAHGIEEFRS